MTTPFENFVNIALGKSVSSDVTLPTANEIPVFTGIGRQVTGKTATELGLALTADLDTDGTLAANSDTKYPSQKAVKTYADTKQAALGDVITANTYGSSTQYPIVTVNAKGIVTGITLQTVAAPATFSDSAFRIQDNGDATKQIAFEASGIATGQTKTITMPNADVNLSDIPSISNFNSNTVSNNGTILSRNSSSNAVNGVVLLSGDSLKTGFGYTIAGAVVVQTGKGQQSYFRPAVFDTLLTDLTLSQISSPLTLTSVAGTANKPYAGAPAGAEFWILAGGLDHVAVHTLTFACSVFGGSSQGVFSGQRRIMVRRLDATDTYTIDNIQTIGTDAVSAGITGVSVAITLDSDRLNIVISHTTATSDHILTSAELHTLVTSLG